MILKRLLGVFTITGLIFMEGDNF